MEERKTDKSAQSRRLLPSDGLREGPLPLVGLVARDLGTKTYREVAVGSIQEAGKLPEQRRPNMYDLASHIAS